MTGPRAIDPHSLRRLYDRLSSRYDLQHALGTAGADGRGRRALVGAAVVDGDRVLDAGGGTGTTALLASEHAAGSVIVLDQSRGMLARARHRADAEGKGRRMAFVVGDIQAPPFRPAAFDVVLSTYSMCPLVSPSEGAAALYRLIRPGGRLGVAHSTEPRGRVVRWAARHVEAWVWRWPGLSMGCRAVSVLPRLRELGAIVELDRYLGLPLWPFHVFVVRRPSTAGDSR